MVNQRRCNSMLKVILSALLFLLMVGCAQQPVFTDSVGKKIPVSKLTGHWLLIDYWAKWCDNCKQEAVNLNKFYSQHKKGNVLVYGVNYDGLQGQQLQEAINAMKIHYPVMQTNPADYFHLGEVNTIPVLYVINPQGKLVKTLYGPKTARQLNQVLLMLKHNIG